jgi:hypothetical protein
MRSRVSSFFFSLRLIGALNYTRDGFFQDLHWTPIAVITLLLAMYIALDRIMDSNTAMFITVPIVSPLARLALLVLFPALALWLPSTMAR